MCPVATIAPIPCPSGYYAAAGATSCTLCTAGQYCPLYSESETACPTGSYSRTAYEQCLTCPAGYSCDASTSADPTICPVTNFKVTEGPGTCSSCPAGQECLDRTTVPTNCVNGEYSLTNNGFCSICAQNGKECPDTSTANTRTCPTGTYYDWWTSPPLCRPCEPGSICRASDYRKLPCGDGFYDNSGSCTICPTGSFCPETYLTPINCPTGFYQPTEGATTCLEIPPGYTSADRVSLTACDAGSYFSGLGSCTDCPVGFMCPDPKIRKIPCMPGEYQNTAKQTTCLTCPAGSTCATTTGAPVAVTGNFFAPAGSIAAIPCPVGYACSTSAVLNPICQWGQYHDGSSCTTCPAGKFCTMIRGDAPRDCQEGSYSPAGYMECIPCPPGQQCAADGTMTACSAGQYTFETEYTCTWGRPNYYTPLTSSSIHAPCPPGSYQDSARNTCLPCPANSSCELTNSVNLLNNYTPSGSTVVACDSGTYSLAGDGFCRNNLNGFIGTAFCALGQYQSASTCVDCQVGHYCPDPSLMPIECLPGTYQDATAQTTCKICTPGKYCLYKATAETDCPVGYYCPVSWEAPIPCPAGHYSDGNAQMCTICPNTKYCDSAANGPLASLGICPPNMYCNTPFQGALPEYRLCPAGYKSAAGAAGVASECTICAAGKYCEYTLSRTEVNCPAGYYCPSGTQHARQYPCPEGTFNSQTGRSALSDCQPCPAGKYCRPGSTTDTNPCPYGAQCAGSADNESVEIWCPQGMYSVESDGQTTCTVCPAGHYCPKASAKAFPCTPGTYRATTGAIDKHECIPCEAGWACRLPGSNTGQQEACANGHFCPLGSQSPYQFPCPYGTWSNGVTQLTGRTGCVDCPAGYACPLGSHKTEDIYPCPQGHYCPAGTKSPYSIKCPAGTYNLLRQKSLLTDCVACPAGYYCAAGSASPTYLCPPGHYCPVNTKYRFQYPCRAGKYQPKWGQTADTACVSCPERYFCPQGVDWPMHCPRGHFCGTEREMREISQTAVGNPLFTTRNAASIVTPGNYAARRSATQTTCADGAYSFTGASRCETCPNGFSCQLNNGGLEHVIVNQKCTAGDWCHDGTGTTHAQCPVGLYCLLGDHLPHQCRAGSYSDAVGKNARLACSTTAVGYWTPPGSAYATRYSCEPGFYCPAGSIQSDQTHCPAGKYRNTIGATAESDCVDCPTGHYCPLGTGEPVPCGDGHYCDVTGLSEPKDCQPGFFSKTDKSTVCEACEIGKACTHYGLSKPDFLCASGFLCTAGQAETSGASITCTAGGYCEMGTTVKESCKAGTYNPNTGKEYLLDCENCPAGQYCAGGNASTTSGPCTAGYYCTGGSTTPTQQVALPGHVTLAGASSATKCPAGEYQDKFAQSTCKQCEAGFYCSTEANDGTARVVCPAGYYCVANSQSPTKCPAGTYSYQQGLIAESECLPCLPGYYCAQTGTYLKSQMALCSAGYFCTSAALVATPETDTSGQNRYGPCTAGHYCPVGTAEPIPCPAGTFSNTAGLTAQGDCTPCTAGKYCPTEGMTSAGSNCDAGYFCPAGEKQPRRAANACPAGFKCPAGSVVQIECASGEYQPNTRQSDCITCPDGYSCVNSKVTPASCAAGHYCQGGNDQTCASGTFSPATWATTSVQCAACPLGKYCVGEGLSSYAAPVDCPEGFYCDNASDKQAGLYTGQCVAGQYCPTGSAFPIDCPGGKFCDGTGTLTDCFAGYYCKQKATKGNPASNSQGGNICPAGYYCPLGSDSPTACPPGTYNPSTGGTALANCLNCPAGKYCQDAGSAVFTGSCNAGYFCPAGVRNVPHPVANICPADHYCDGGSAAIACTANSQYQPNTGQSACLTCPAGFQCSASGFTDCNTDHESYCDSAYQRQSCPTGHYSPNPNAAASSQCVAITAGFSFSVAGSTFTQSVCTAGKYCSQGSSSFNSCPAGFYCPAGSATPIKCPAGQYCAGVDNISPDGACDAGYYCIEGATSATPTDGTTGNICPKGHYCTQGVNSPIACPIGTYRSSLQGTQLSDCAACDAGRYCDGVGLESPNILCFQGYFCDASSTSPNPREHSCTPGNKCPVGSTAMTPCAIAEYQPSPLQGSCLPCPERYFCPTTGMRAATICPAGAYCAQGVSASTNCPIGTYSPKTGLKSVNQCKQCPLGYACETAGMTSVSASELCTAGYYCPLGSSSKTQNNCPAGYYCPAGTHTPIACPVGTYSDAVNLSLETQCTDCPAGQYCPLTAASSAQVQSDTYKCTAGYLCTGKAITATPVDSAEGGRYCAAGKYCPRGATAEVACPLGFYNPYEGRALCVTCPAGRLCDETGLTAFKDCPAGSYCPAGVTGAVACPAGTYSPRTNLGAESECLECDPGKYCVGGQTAVSGDCDAGFACSRGSGAQAPTAVFTFSAPNNGICPEGHYCPAGSKLPVQCPEGTFSSSTGLLAESACTPCSAGFYCDKKGLVSPSKQCAAGFYCISGATHPKPTDGTKGQACSAGNYCTAGTTSEIPCPAGRYEPRQGSSECQACPAGYYCPIGSSAPVLCPFEKYCPAGSDAGTNCPAGTYNSDQLGLENSAQCTPCTTGKYCQQGQIQGDCAAGYFCHTGAAVSNPSDQRCPKGHYCLAGSTAPTVCPQGQVNENEGADELSDCTACPLGYYCLAGDPVPHECPRGYYCDGNTSGNADPEPCPVDYYNPNLRQDSSADCIHCPAGVYCDQTGIAYLDLFECEKGKVCLDDPTPGTLVAPQACAAGTYNPSKRKGLASDCLQCPGGSYCNVATGTIYPIKCRSGQYCPAGSSGETPCTAGNYCPYGSAAEIPCPAGYFCPNVEMDLYIKCVPGQYCPQGSSAQTPCPIGTYGLANPANHDEAAECSSCEQGSYQDATGATTCLQCPAGYICLEGANKQNPTDLATDKGKICQAGYYCPAGSWEEKPCPIGTYQPETGKSAESDCLPCAISFFNNKQAQTACVACGANAFNLVARESSCACKGKNRDFQPDTQRCMCSVSYEPVGTDSLENSSLDCQPIVYPLCSGSTVYNDRRECVPANNCNSECSAAVGGSVIDTIGLCECSTVSDPNLVCDSACRSAKDQYSLNANGEIVITTSTGTTTTHNRSTLTQLSSSNLICAGSCRMYSVGFSSGFFSGNYEMQNYVKNTLTGGGVLLQQKSSQPQTYRELTSSQTEILNPIVCLKQGESLVFSVDSSTKQYPVYDTASLLNTNNSFDYSAFTTLQSDVEGGSSTISAFAFTFQTAGTYVFMNSLDTSKKLVVAIRTDSNSCPSSDTYIMATTQQNLLSVGVEPKSNLYFDPNWILIFGVLVGIIILVAIFVCFVLYYKRKQWRVKPPVSLPYRRLHQVTQFEEVSANTKTLFKKKDDSDTSGLSSSHASDYEREEAEKKAKLNERYAIEQQKLDDMLMQTDRISMEFLGSDDRAEDMQRIVQMRVRDLLERLRKIREGEDEHDIDQRPSSEARRSSVLGAGGEMEEARKKEAQRVQREQERQMEKMEREKEEFMKKLLEDGDARAEKFKQMLENKELSEEQRLALMQDYQMGERRINGILEEEERKQQDDLQRKLEQRRERRNKLRRKMEDLESEKAQKNRELRGAMEDLNDETAAKMRQMEDELQAEEDEVLGQVKERMEKQREAKRSEFQSLLARNKRSDEMEQMVGEYEEESHALERKLQLEFDMQKKTLKQTLHERRERKRLQLENERRDKEKELIIQRDQEMAELDHQLEKLRKVAENDKLNERIEAMVDQHLGGENEALEAMKQENEAAQAALQRKHRDELDRLEVESEADSSSQHQQTRDLIDLEGGDQEEEKIKRKAEELRKQLEGSDDPELRAQLLRQLEEQEQLMAMRLKKEQQEQKASLDEKLAKRRLKKLERRKQLEAGQEAERRGLVEQQAEDEARARARKDDEELARILHEIKLNVEVDARPFAVQKAVDEKHARELSELLMRQFKEKALELQAHMSRLMAQKTDELTINKDMHAAQRARLDEMRGAVQEQELERQSQELQRAEADKREDIEDKYLELQAQGETEITKRLLDRHTQQLLELKQTQHKQKQRVIEQYIPEGLAREIFAENPEELEEEMRRFAEEIEERRLREMEALKERERILKEQSEQYRTEREKLDAHKHFLTQHTAFQGGRKKARKFDIEQDALDARRQRLVEEYKQIDEEMKQALESEQSRQKEAFQDKLKKREELRKKMRQKREEEMEELKRQQQLEEERERELEKKQADSHVERLVRKHAEVVFEKVKGAWTFPKVEKKKPVVQQTAGAAAAPKPQAGSPVKPIGTFLNITAEGSGLLGSRTGTPRGVGEDDDIVARIVQKLEVIEERLKKSGGAGGGAGGAA